MAQPVLPKDLRDLASHTTVVLFLLTVGYYLLPLRSLDRADDFGRLLASFLALGLVVVVFRRRDRKIRGVLSPALYRVQWLLSVLYTLVLGFALTYAVIAAHSQGQIVGIENRTDALYFSITLVSTVGFGDIHAVGTFARLLVTVHMLFNLIYLGTALRLLGGAASRPS